MIQFSLKCDQDHQFDSWFQSAEAFDKLKSAGMVTCAVCGSADVTKAIMAPRVRPARNVAPRPLSTPSTPEEQAVAELKKQVEANSDYVGNKFAQEARAIHDGDAPERAIYGEAKLEDAKSLIDDGIPVMPLPFRPSDKSS